ncbi:hypothetical protein EOW77_0008285 [Bradyrhizobium yuanmingense]|uniref:hypothetical protein n=1 Tax=Bradyrhizobium yuanmingense TaxID=108015 RepID=UPI000FE2D85A|nr:hypothetical protein [Bradyrhizobium yuanmingense]TGN88849.1 hypothetical protein EOW77_0008285 [Bradyrhizobium yuanmingense]
MARELGAGIAYAFEKGWLMLHESGTCAKLLAPGEDLLANVPKLFFIGSDQTHDDQDSDLNHEERSRCCGDEKEIT